MSYGDDSGYGGRKQSGYGDDSNLGDSTEGGYGQKTSGYGDDTTQGGYGQQTGGYGDDAGQGGYGQKASTGYGDDAGQGGYGQKTSTGYGDDSADAGYGQKSTSGYGSQQKDSDGDGTPDEFQNSQFNKEDVENLKDRTDIDDDEREHRRKKLMAEVAGGVVGAGVLGFAGYEAYQHFGKDDDDQKAVGDDGQPIQQTGDGEQPEKKSSWF